VLSISALAAMRAHVQEARRAGRRVGFVPTMGALHAGHLSLVAAARARSDVVVLSVFVNPLQFGPGEDFERYPRDLERDTTLAASAAVDVLWAPSREEMYPEAPQVTVVPGRAGAVLEGAARPGHFAGVLTVVLKLFGVVQPDVAVFGRKDFQQAALVRRMVRDLNLPVDLVVAPTIRERDGLALSSRNVYLDAAARSAAGALPRALACGVDAFRGGERDAGVLAAVARRILDAERGLTVDYAACLDPGDLEPAGPADERSVLAVAARAGRTRLIDNVVLGDGLEKDIRVAG
jgi:pantoate--beta-alanine ligase